MSVSDIEISAAGNAASTTATKPSTAPPPTTPPVNKWDQYRTDQQFLAGATIRTSAIVARKPTKFEWITIRREPEYHFTARVYDHKPTGKVYLVHPAIQAEIASELTTKLIVPCITRAEVLFLWPVPLPTERENAWTTSALDAMRRAMDGWVRVVPNLPAMSYDVQTPFNELPAPIWPDITIEQMISAAFTHYTIDSLDHPRIKDIRGI
jgi:hypothetical protein